MYIRFDPSTLSESCAPISMCPAVHDELAREPGVSRVPVMYGDDPGPFNTEIPAEIRPAAHHDEWVTLTLDAALSLAADEDSLHDKCVPRPTRNHWTPG